MAASHETFAPAWSIRLAADLSANDQSARDLVGGITDEQLNWQPAAGCWSIGQCLEHLCVTNECYLPAISAALKEQPRSPVEEITPGWFGGWFIRSFVEPSPKSKRASAPGRSGRGRVPIVRFSIVVYLATRHAVSLSYALARTT
jgi:DinB superfamily